MIEKKNYTLNKRLTNTASNPHTESCIDTTIIYKKMRTEMYDDALTMPLQLSLSVLPVVLSTDTVHGAHIVTTLAALAGPTGCLPPLYTETALQQIQDRNHSYADFIALFQGHLADLLIEASTKYSAPKQNQWRHNDENPFLNGILAMSGYDTTKNERILKAYSIRFASFFSDDRRNAANLKIMLENIFNVSMEIAEFQPRWQKIVDCELSFLGRQCRLGVDSFIGTLSRQASSHFLIIVGPLCYEKFLAFLPDQQEFKCLSALTQYYCGLNLTFDIQLILQENQVPAAKLSGKYRLGYDLWLQSNGPRRKRADTIFGGQTIGETSQWDFNYV